MAAEIQSERARQAQELKELQESYAKAKKKTQSEGQAELEQVRSENIEKVSKERDSGQATINHISNKSKQQIEETKQQGQEKITYEKQNVARQFRTHREKGREDIGDLQDSIAQQKAALAKQEGAIRNKVAEMEKYENAATKEVARAGQDRRHSVVKSNQEEIANLQKNAQAGKAKVRESQVVELRKMIEQHRTQTEFLKKQQTDILQRQKTMTGAQLRDRETADGQRLETQRQQFIEREQKLRATAQKNVAEETAEANQHIQELKKNNQETVKHERDRGHAVAEKTRNEYTKQIQTVQTDGKKEVARQVSLHEQTLALENASFRKQIDEKQDVHRQNAEELSKNHRKELERNQTGYRKQMEQQKAEYDSAFVKNDKVFSDSLQDQHDRLTLALAKDKLKVTEDVGRYNQMKEDPFYRLNKVDTQLSDDGHQYILTAKVPEHEKENLKVFVQGQNLVVQGHRKFEDKVADENRNVKTSNYQTFREEIPLGEAVREKFVHKNWENGVLTVKIPKA